MSAETPVRVLVVDDSATVRSIVSRGIERDPGLEVCGVAANGRIALEKITVCTPDLVILDIEMPEMDGLATLTVLRSRHPALPVLIYSTLTERGAAATIGALLRGANDYVTKPSSLGRSGGIDAHLRDELLPRVRALVAPRVTRRIAAPTPRPLAGAPRARVLAMGASTGGPTALARLVAELPADLPVPVVVVQHMPALFTRALAEQLDAVGRIRVAEARPGTVLSPGRVWIAPGDHHLQVEAWGDEKVLRIDQREPVNSCRPSIDVLFRSVAEVYGDRALAVVLTGMGSDGVEGAQAIRRAGGRVLAQDESSSVVWGIPRFVIERGLADAAVPLEHMAGEILARLDAGVFHNDPSWR
jgi:two-component system chemotaxis response regulator CheB